VHIFVRTIYISCRPIVGHVGDGNFHVLLVFDANNIDEMKRVKECSTILAQY